MKWQMVNAILHNLDSEDTTTRYTAVQQIGSEVERAFDLKLENRQWRLHVDATNAVRGTTIPSIPAIALVNKVFEGGLTNTALLRVSC